MAYRKRYNKAKRGRRGRKRKNYPTPSRNLGPLAVKLPSKMIYNERFQISPGVAGLANEYVFTCNGMFDPNITGTGHQPRGFDQLMALYDHYVVVGFKATMWFSNQDLTDGVYVSAYINDISSPTTGAEVIMEKRYLKLKQLGVETSNNQANMQISVAPHKYLGRSRPLSDPELKGSASANPTEQCYLHIGTFPTTTGTDTGAVDVNVRLEYYCILIEPKQPAAS